MINPRAASKFNAAAAAATSGRIMGFKPRERREATNPFPPCLLRPSALTGILPSPIVLPDNHLNGAAAAATSNQITRSWPLARGPSVPRAFSAAYFLQRRMCAPPPPSHFRSLSPFMSNLSQSIVSLYSDILGMLPAQLIFIPTKRMQLWSCTLALSLLYQLLITSVKTLSLLINA